MSLLPDVAAGQPHVAAHNNERHKINEHDLKFAEYAPLANAVLTGTPVLNGSPLLNQNDILAFILALA